MLQYDQNNTWSHLLEMQKLSHQGPREISRGLNCPVPLEDFHFYLLPIYFPIPSPGSVNAPRKIYPRCTVPKSHTGHLQVFCFVILQQSKIELILI